MIREIQSQGLGVNTIFSPLSVNLSLEQLSNSSLRQWYFVTEDKYSPSHAISPVRLKPAVSVHDPETMEAYTPTLASVIWKVTDKDGTTQYTFNDTSADYSVSSDGTLTVRKDIPYDNPVTLLCSVRYTGRTGEAGVVEKSVQLVTDVTSDTAYSIQVCGASNGKGFGNKLWWNPLSGTTSRMTITAKAMLGGDDATNSVKFFWYYVSGDEEVLVDDSQNPCLAYVSGQGTKTLTVDAAYESEDVEFRVRIAEDGSAVAPDVIGVCGTATLRWYIGKVNVEAYSDQGDACRQGNASHTFKVRVKQNGIDVDESLVNQYMQIEWRRSYTNSNGSVTTTSEGNGSTITIGDDRLRNNQYPVAVTPIPTLKGSIRVVYMPFSVVSSTSGKNPKNEGWYVKSGENYTLTTHTSPQSGTTYYKVDAGGTLDGVVTYTQGGVVKVVTY